MIRLVLRLNIYTVEYLIWRCCCLMVLYSNLTNFERLLLTLEHFLIFPIINVFAKPNLLERSQAEPMLCIVQVTFWLIILYCRISFCFIIQWNIFVVDDMVWYCTQSWSTLNVCCLVWNSSLYSPASISAILVQAIWSGCVYDPPLVNAISRWTDAIYGVCI